MKSVYIVNPLPDTLSHYQDELVGMGSSLGLAFDIDARNTNSVEGLGRIAKILRSVYLVGSRMTRYLSKRSPILVLWPAFGYWDVLTWLVASWRRPIILVVHDVMPLRPLFGYSSLAIRAFGLVSRAGRYSIICHTDAAHHELFELTGVRALVLPHPIMPGKLEQSVAVQGSRRTIRVLGQYKQARDLEALKNLPYDLPNCDFEIIGRGWPAMDGWSVTNEFVSEERFDALVHSADCLVIPYATFYQSGVAVRALEGHTPVVCGDHPQIRFLFGEEWCGLVGDTGWTRAVSAALTVSKETLAQRHIDVCETVEQEWRRVISGV